MFVHVLFSSTKINLCETERVQQLLSSLHHPKMTKTHCETGPKTPTIHPRRPLDRSQTWETFKFSAEEGSAADN
jgi:hypothetical protein